MPKKKKPEEEPEEQEGRRAKVVDLVWDCPYCDKPCSATVVRQTITPAVPAETELVAVVKKDDQRKLDLGGEEEGKSGAVRVRAEKVK